MDVNEHPEKDSQPLQILQMPTFGGSSKDRRRLERAWSKAMQTSGVSDMQLRIAPSKSIESGPLQFVSEHPRIAFVVSMFALAFAPVLGFLGVRMKNPAPLLVFAWLFCVFGVVVLCTFLKRFRKTAIVIGIVVSGAILYYLNIHYPASLDKPQVTNKYGPSLIHNEGTIGFASVTNSSIDGNPEGGISLFGQPPHGGIAGVTMNNVHVIYGNGAWNWSTFLDNVEKRSGNADLIRQAVEKTRKQVDSELAKLPASEAAKQFCKAQLSDVTTRILSNTSDEKAVIEDIRKNPPYCFKPPQ
jgi:hypothetical protein